MTTYICYFTFQGQNRQVVANDRGPRDFMEGFWLNQKLEFTHGMDAMWWIPPHRIEYIKAERNEFCITRKEGE